jgi:Ser-tRNA(Ala) deacylase AlaX
MTDKIFWNAPYLTQLDTHVASVNGDDVTVEQTIFYALSGGQESDHGSIGDRRVMHARKEGGEIVYTLVSGHGLRSGDRVTMQINWERRYRLMRLHFAAEIVLELVYRKLNGIQKIGAHIAQDKARIDFVWDRNISTLFPELKSEVLQIVADKSAIGSGFSDQQTQKRYWEIDGFARVPCGGTHLRNTAEVGAIELKRKNIGKGKERIEIYLDNGAPGQPV